MTNDCGGYYCSEEHGHIDCQKVIIGAKSVMGWPVWVVKISEPIDTGEGMSPIVSTTNKKQKATVYTRSEAESMLEGVRTAYPSAEIQMV